MKNPLWPLILPAMLLSAASFDARAQMTPDDGEPDDQPSRWGLGLGVVVIDSPYAGEGTRAMPFPLVSFEGERFYVQGLGAGWRLMESDTFELSVVGQLRFDGFEVDDLGRDELAANGVDRDLLEDRDIGFDVGLGMTWSGRGGELELELLADASDTSGGQEIALSYGYPLQVGRGQLTPSVGVTWQSEDMADYNYGTLDEEVARGVVDYKPGAVTVPHVGIDYVRPLGGKWTMLAFARYSTLPDEIKDSPFIEADTDGMSSVFLGFSRGF